jgi:hypothetical protein
LSPDAPHPATTGELKLKQIGRWQASTPTE